MMTIQADMFFSDGCGRCSLMSTPQCKVQRWKAELAELRRIMRSTALTEDCKWGMPCYTLEKANVIMIAAFKENCSLSFFKGALIDDPEGLLEKAGENSQAARQLRCRSVEQIIQMEPVIRELIDAAIKVERSGLKVELNSTKELELSEEFVARLHGMPALKKAFESLTPGRRRSHHLFISSAKQAKTREGRIDKCIPVILAGKGWNE